MAAASPKWQGVYDSLEEVAEFLEASAGDMQDIEFTVQDGVLWLLQTRNAKRSSRAAIRVALDMLDEQSIDGAEVLRRVRWRDLEAAMRPTVAKHFKKPGDVEGIGACGGVAQGVAVFSPEEALACDGPCILFRKETTPDDIAGMEKALAIVTAFGGETSHAAVVARGMNKPCVVGCKDMVVTDQGCTLGGKHMLVNGSKVTVDGDGGRVWLGHDVPLEAVDPKYNERVIKLALDVEANDYHRFWPLGVRANGVVRGVSVADWYGWSNEEVDAAIDEAFASGTLFVVSTPTHHVSDNDANAPYMALFGNHLDGRVGRVVTRVCQHAVNYGKTNNAVVLLGAAKVYQKEFEDAGVPVVGDPRTMLEFVMSEAVLLTKEFVSEVLGSTSVIGMLGLHDVVVIPGYAPWDELLMGRLGG
jgi:phosphohistidine swiveling domain-containing protein